MIIVGVESQASLPSLVDMQIEALKSLVHEFTDAVQMHTFFDTPFFPQQGFFFFNSIQAMAGCGSFVDCSDLLTSIQITVLPDIVGIGVCNLYTFQVRTKSHTGPN
jgi:hypothetical protein